MSYIIRDLDVRGPSRLDETLHQLRPVLSQHPPMLHCARTFKWIIRNGGFYDKDLDIFNDNLAIKVLDIFFLI